MSNTQKTVKVIQMIIGYLRLGGKTLTKDMRERLRDALSEVITRWYQPDEFEAIQCGFCCGTGWRSIWRAKHQYTKVTRDYVLAACNHCNGSGQAYRRRVTKADRLASKGCIDLATKTGKTPSKVEWA